MKQKIILIAVFIGIATNAYADKCEDACGYSCTRIVNAIYKAEGGNRTKYPYGIKSVSCDSVTECRRICLNTVKNNVDRWMTARELGDNRDYLTFLWHRYCPPQANELNSNWLKNVKYFLNKQED